MDDLKKKKNTTKAPCFKKNGYGKWACKKSSVQAATPHRSCVAEDPWAHQDQVCKVLRDLQMLKTASEAVCLCLSTANIGSLCFLCSWALTGEHLKPNLVHRVAAAVPGNTGKCSNNEKCFSICHYRPSFWGYSWCFSCCTLTASRCEALARRIQNHLWDCGSSSTHLIQCPPLKPNAHRTGEKRKKKSWDWLQKTFQFAPGF